ncbi:MULTISPECIES: hypothetical protein [unclassified Methylophaga]|jgi:UDP-N-acetylmuramyl tripeptide synthase|uniref:hypothetical protein n=1 Tax=unclassified Methylophaga TaxID=2629249 RepID=UPI00259D2943|nr:MULTISPECIES: hypothetical protein [unclassified Methylophaga]|tara:strand:- start:17928 stop:18242 length:315 start_codon:yes stop_codon:yes gene_type:complete
MLVKNNTARIIGINSQGEKSVKVLPGDNPAVEITAKMAKLDFVKELIKQGQLVVVTEEESEDKPKTEKEQLIEDIEALGIEAKSSWTIKQLKEELEKALSVRRI